MSKTKMQCVVSGKVVSVRPDIYEQRVQKFGSEDALVKGYISNESKRLLREGKTVDQIRQLAGTAADKSLQSSTQLADTISRVMKPTKVPKAAKTVKDVDPSVTSFLNTAMATA